jgi:hypothetical protein
VTEPSLIGTLLTGATCTNMGRSELFHLVIVLPAPRRYLRMKSIDGFERRFRNENGTLLLQ